MRYNGGNRGAHIGVESRERWVLGGRRGKGNDADGGVMFPVLGVPTQTMGPKTSWMVALVDRGKRGAQEHADRRRGGDR